MTEIKIFEKEGIGSIRTSEINGEIWFVGKDVAEALGYTNPSKALNDHVYDDDKLNNESLSSLGQRGGWLINESGLYALIFGSKLEKAKEFKHWVTSEVLPSIRKTGSYTAERKEDDDTQLVLAHSFNARLLSEIGKRYSDIPEYQQACDAYATREIAGKFLIGFAESPEKLWTATEIAKDCDVSVQKLGAIANKNGIKTDENGKWIVDIAKSGKQVRNFQYNDKGKSELEKLLKK